MSLRIRVILAAVALVLLAGVAVAWIFENRISPAAPPGSPGEYHVRVMRDGRELASYNLGQLRALGMKKVVVQGGAEEGPPLLKVLSRAGVSEFDSLTIVGQGQRDSGRLVLSAAEVSADTVLDIAKRGTVKIAGPAIPRDKRVRDITEMQVK
jgi:hypothetical protein